MPLLELVEVCRVGRSMASGSLLVPSRWCGFETAWAFLVLSFFMCKVEITVVFSPADTAGWNKK